MPGREVYRPRNAFAARREALNAGWTRQPTERTNDHETLEILWLEWATPMKTSKLITAENIITDLRATNKPEILAEFATRASSLVHLERSVVFNALLDRESFGSTGLGMGVAIPNARFRQLRRPFALFARLKRAIDFHALDRRPVDLILMLLGPEPANAAYLDALTSASRALRNPAVREGLRACADAQSILARLNEDFVGLRD